ncbi:hypothetical protein [uncultured Victivallis sp.]|uniref:hypothetical protein n=1 Tax=uncultured Victivallis sp. TaxID=354118 RepID=UPI00260075BB|nr:hypothetical protein [uncultured Victivallis sp.]
MREGESIVCPRCGERSIVKSKNKMDGFSLVGKVLVCALCGAELGKPVEGGAEKKNSTADRLAALLGESAPPEAKADLTPGDGYGRFCRNCVYFIEHPFKTLCGVDGHAADPMGECPRFKKKEEASC